MEFILEYKTATATQKVGDKLQLSSPSVEIGRDSSCDVKIDESCSTVSRKHAKIECEGDRFKVTALSQTNSTYVNGTPVKGERYLNNGDELKFSSQGPTMIFRFNDPRATRAVDAAATATLTNVATSQSANAAPRPQAPAPAPAPTPAPAPAKKSNMPIIIAVVVAAIAAIGGAAYFLLNKPKPEVKPVVEAAAPEPVTIESVFKSIYFIKVTDISVYDQNKNLIMTFNTNDKLTGTGFMVDNGKFITAKSVVEPWLVVENGIVGNDSTARSWTYNELTSAGYNIVTNCTAYTSAGTSFKFSNVDCISNDNTGDWVSIAKAEQLGTVGGIPADSEWSIKPQYGTECQIVSYLPNSDIQSLTPSTFTNAVNVSELNKDNYIELSSQRWQNGVSGSPVLIEKGGQYVVIGIMTKSNIADRDVLVPIANALQ